MGHVRPCVGHVSYWCPTRVGVPLVSDMRTHYQLGVSVLHRKRVKIFNYMAIYDFMTIKNWYYYIYIKIKPLIQYNLKWYNLMKKDNSKIKF